MRQEAVRELGAFPRAVHVVDRIHDLAQVSRGGMPSPEPDPNRSKRRRTAPARSTASAHRADSRVLRARDALHPAKERSAAQDQM